MGSLCWWVKKEHEFAETLLVQWPKGLLRWNQSWKVHFLKGLTVSFPLQDQCELSDSVPVALVYFLCLDTIDHDQCSSSDLRSVYLQAYFCFPLAKSSRQSAACLLWVLCLYLFDGLLTDPRRFVHHSLVFVFYIWKASFKGLILEVKVIVSEESSVELVLFTPISNLTYFVFCLHVDVHTNASLYFHFDLSHPFGQFLCTFTSFLHVPAAPIFHFIGADHCSVKWLQRMWFLF